MSGIAPLLNRLRFHLDRLSRDPGSEEDWGVVLESTQLILAHPPVLATRECHQILAQELPALLERRLPANLVHLQRVLDAASKRLGKQPGPAAAAQSDLERLRELLAGREVLVVGGDPREHHRENLEEALQAGSVHWPLTRESAPDVSALEPLVARPGIALVLLYIRFVRHAISDELPKMCERHGRPLARITAGYNPAKVAHQVLQQCSERL